MLITTKAHSRIFGETNGLENIDGLRLSCRLENGSENTFTGVLSFDTNKLIIVRRMSPYDTITESVTLKEVIVRFYRSKTLVAIQTLRYKEEA